MYVKSLLKNYRSFFLLISILCLGGCMTVDSEYMAPKIKLTLDQQAIFNFTETSKKESNCQWMSIFDDPILCDLVKSAYKNNLDLLSAIARVEESRANLDVTMGSKFPSLRLSGSILNRERYDNNLRENLYKSNVDLSWEIDLFGRIRHSVEVSKAEYQISKEDRNSVMASLLSTLFLNYIEIRTKQARLKYLQKNIKIQKENLELILSCLKNGMATELDVAQTKRILAKTEAKSPLLKASLLQSINSLAILIGRQPSYVQNKVMLFHQIPKLPEQTVLNIPENFLQQRPDVRKAEKIFAAQTAKIGIATSKLYPTIFIRGFFGFESTHSDELFYSKNNIFSFGPSFSWNLYSGGTIRNEIKIQDARAKQSLLAYEKVILKALIEVENILNYYISNKTRLVSIRRSVNEASLILKLSTELYKQGIIDLKSILEAQQIQLETQNQLAVVKGITAAYFVKLYAALGGFWDFKKPIVFADIENDKVSIYNK